MPSLSGRLHELVEKLDALGPAASLVDLAQALEAAPLTADDVAAWVHPNPRNYNRATVVLREQYELLVMTWLPGQASVPHDHTGSICAMQVVKGEAAEASYRVAPDGYVDLEYETVLRAGEVTSGQDAGVHTVRNMGNDVLVTVHAYSPPIKDFRRFVPRPDSLGDQMRTDANGAPTVVVVGGGFSGAVIAAQVLRRAASARPSARVNVVLVERRGSVGEGVAYGTRAPCHLLNVPAAKMSAWPDRPNDFLEWTARRYGKVRPEDFVPRQWFGEYVRESLLATARDAAKSADLSVILDEVRRVARHPSGGWMVHLARGASVRADAVVIAIGHRPPTDPIARRWNGPRTRFIADPWSAYAMNTVGPDEPVVVLGSGLTAVDAVLLLSQSARSAPITLVSRRGLLPHAHAAAHVPPANLEPLVSELLHAAGGVCAKRLYRELRKKGRELAYAGADWRSLVDGLRPHIAKLWQAMPRAERRRFLSHLRPFWEIHRHRMPPAVAERFHALLASGQVRVIAGRVDLARADETGVQITIRERGSERLHASHAAWVINCTGPSPANDARSNPVIGSLLVHGWLCSDELSLGIETGARGNAVDASGDEVSDLFVVGTLRKPSFWESTAVPELRNQAAAVAERVSDLLLHRAHRLAARSDEATNPDRWAALAASEADGI
jgi:uncharacterized NAD(P)/FAD-binding protein YdhS/predicted metal-dependent enzyme (double-stranded beta helix superfamily)